MLFMSDFGRIDRDFVFRQLLGRRPCQLPMSPQLRMAHGELGHAAVHDGRRGFDIAMSIGQLGQLPEEALVSRQPQGELLYNRHGIGQQFLTLGRR